MGVHSFRFAIQAVPEDGGQWLATARRAEQLGYHALLMADGMRLPSVIPALALAAGATTTLHVGAFVLASPLRPPQMAASEAHTLSLLTGGRYELGIGTGRPEVAVEAVELLGQPPTTAAQRLAQVEQTIDALRALDGDRRTPVLMAAAGPRARALAAAKADIVTLAAGAATSREHVAAMMDDVRSAAGERASGIEFMQPVFVIGDEPLPWVRRFLQADMATLVEVESLLILRGTAREMADELQRRRERLGISYVSVNAAYLDEFAPVVELLAGR
jgi:alkanesulfonate monooxygenase SsuD/methylene tetrahydromethanopterin reductase-like flavin-dependent oxidoreductase (luciferase family)